MANDAQTKNLNDENVQAEILNPPTREIEFAGQKLTLHALSGHGVRMLTGLTELVLASSASEATNAQSASLRIGGVLVSQYYERFLPIFVQALQPAGEMDATQQSQFYNEINDKIGSARGATAARRTRELANAFAMMADQNGIMEAFNPKKEEPPEKPLENETPTEPTPTT